MKNLVLIITTFVCAFSLKAQQEAMFTHYAFNTLTINPGYAGSRAAMTATLLHRSQWVGFEGAPHTQTLTVHTPIGKYDMGVGLSVANDKIGPINNTSVYVDYAYKIPLTAGVLSAGIKGGVDIMQARLTGLAATDADDASIYNNIQNRTMPNFGLGAYYSLDKYYVGLSSPRILQNKIDVVNSTTGRSKEQMHFYLVGGAMFDLSERLQAKPMGLLKVTAAAAPQFDLTGLFVLDKRFEIGAAYRTGDSFGVLFGINFENHLRAGYSFDWSTGVATGSTNGGSHEIMLRYDFIMKSQKKIITPRYF